MDLSFAITIAEAGFHIYMYIVADDRRTFCDLGSAIVWDPMELKQPYIFTMYLPNLVVDRICDSYVLV